MTKQSKEKKQLRVCIDPGHGGYDPGAIGPGYTLEKDVVLGIALHVKEVLEANQVDVVMTREEDPMSKLDLKTRVYIANASNADYVVSIHANGSEYERAQGIETFAYAHFCNSFDLATQVQNCLVDRLGWKDRGVRVRKEFAMVGQTEATAILVEVGFLTNAEEEQLLRTGRYQQYIGEAIAQGILQQADRQYGIF